MKTAIIGIGNEFRGDDAAGLLVAKKLKQQFPQLKIFLCDGNLTNLFSFFAEYEKFIIVDAAITTEETLIGQIQHLIIDENTNFSEINFYSSHSIGLLQSIHIAKNLNMILPQIHIYAIYGKKFNMGDEISEKVNDAINQVINKLINDHFYSLVTNY